MGESQLSTWELNQQLDNNELHKQIQSFIKRQQAERKQHQRSTSSKASIIERASSYGNDRYSSKQLQ